MLKWLKWKKFRNLFRVTNWEAVTSPETVCPMGFPLTLVKQLFKLFRAGDQEAVKPGGVIMVVRLMVSGRVQSERDEVLPPYLNLAERTCCCVSSCYITSATTTVRRQRNGSCVVNCLILYYCRRRRPNSVQQCIGETEPIGYGNGTRGSGCDECHDPATLLKLHPPPFPDRQYHYFFLTWVTSRRNWTDRYSSTFGNANSETRKLDEWTGSSRWVQNTANVVHGRNWQTLVDRLWLLSMVKCFFYSLCRQLEPWFWLCTYGCLKFQTVCDSRPYYPLSLIRRLT